MTTAAKPGVFEENGQWQFRCGECETVGTSGATSSREAARKAYQAHRQEAHPVTGTIPKAGAAPVEQSTEETETPAEKKPKGKKTKEKKEKKKPGRVTNGAVGRAWEIFAKNPKRKEALEACATAGINPNTAKTQYFRWTHRDAVKKEA